jgi:hypothetical protein
MVDPAAHERDQAVRTEAARLVQAVHHDLAARRPLDDDLVPLIAPVEHLASLLESDAPYSLMREAALAAVDRYEWPSPDTSAGDEGPVIDPAILAAVERLRSAIDAMDVLNGNGEPDEVRPPA